MTCNTSAGTICIKWGNPYTRDVSFAQNGSQIDLTDYTILWALKRDLNTTNDNTAVAKGTLAITDQSGVGEGLATWTITSAQTKVAYGTYTLDFKVFNASDELVGNTSYFTVEIVPVSTQDELPEA